MKIKSLFRIPSVISGISGKKQKNGLWRNKMENNGLIDIKRLRTAYAQGKLSKEDMLRKMAETYENMGQHDKAQQLFGIELGAQDKYVWKSLGY